MDINALTEQVDSLKKKADLLRPFKPERERVFWEKFRLEFNYNSNHMEGNTLTYGQTKLLLLFDRLTGDFKARDVEEMKAHNAALKMISELAADSESRLTEKLIREINELILVRPFYSDAITPDGQPTKKLITPGKYKSEPNHVLLPDGGKFYYASPEETPAMMGDLIEWYNQNKGKMHPVRLAALMHYKLVRIHPFDDSNGRTTRLIMNFILMQNGYAPVVIGSKKKDSYLAALNKADIGNIDAFEKYIAEVSLKWQGIFLKAMNGEKIEEDDDLNKEIELLKKNLSGNKGPTSEISGDAVWNTFNNSLLPLFKSIDKDLNGLKDLFLKSYIAINAPNSNKVFENLGSVERSINPFIVSLTSGGELRVEFQHIGFSKAGTKTFNLYPTISIKFLTYIYQIQINNLSNEVFEKLYYDNLTENEIEIISRKIAKLELEEIRIRINQSNT
jgi:Fic family protein